MLKIDDKEIIEMVKNGAILENIFITKHGPVEYKEIFKKGQQVGRRKPCPCGSGKKYKSCCYPIDRERAERKFI